MGGGPRRPRARGPPSRHGGDTPRLRSSGLPVGWLLGGPPGRRLPRPLSPAWTSRWPRSCLPCSALPCSALPCSALPCAALPCSALPCSALPCSAACSALPARSCLLGPGHHDPSPDEYRLARSWHAAADLGEAPGTVAAIAHGRQRIASERLDLRPRELPPLAGQQAAQRQAAHGDPLELVHFVAEPAASGESRGSLPSSRTISSMRSACAASESTPLGVHLSLGQPHAPADSPRTSSEGHRPPGPVGLLDAIPGMGQQVGQVAVVGDQDQSLAHCGRAARWRTAAAPGTRSTTRGCPDRDRSWWSRPRPACTRCRRPASDRAVAHRRRDLLGRRIDAAAQFRDHLPVDLDAAGADQFLAGRRLPSPAAASTFCSRSLPSSALRPVAGPRPAAAGFAGGRRGQRVSAGRRGPVGRGERWGGIGGSGRQDRATVDARSYTPGAGSYPIATATGRAPTSGPVNFRDGLGIVAGPRSVHDSVSTKRVWADVVLHERVEPHGPPLLFADRAEDRANRAGRARHSRGRGRRQRPGPTGTTTASTRR